MLIAPAVAGPERTERETTFAIAMRDREQSRDGSAGSRMGLEGAAEYPGSRGWWGPVGTTPSSRSSGAPAYAHPERAVARGRFIVHPHLNGHAPG